MSASNEIFEYHLTSRGWESGSQKLDFQGWTHRETPSDRLLTVEFNEYLASSFSKMDWSADVSEHADMDAIKAAIKQHGDEPHPGAHKFNGWPQYVAKLAVR